MRLSAKLLVLAVSALVLAPPGAVAAGNRCAVPGARNLRCAGSRLTVRARPSTVIAGGPMVINGRLRGPRHARRRLTLWHRLAGQRRFTRVLSVRTDRRGRYSIVRGRGVVETNRAWFVSRGALRSRVIQERVRARVTLALATPTVAVGDPLALSGTVTPAHAGARVIVEQRTGGGWRRVATAQLSSSSSFTAQPRFDQAGAVTLRVVFPGDRRNSAGVSSPVAVTVTPGAPAGDIHKIKHVVVIMQENRSFDSYFGTYPGANGIPMKDGQPTVCVPDPKNGGCVKPYHDPRDLNHGGPHGQGNATADIDGGKMDGFVAQAQNGSKCTDPNDPVCTKPGATDVMGYHDAREIPNYWAYARNFVLQDAMFEPNASWSLPEHLFMVSEWSAHCTRLGDPFSCTNALQSPGNPPDFQGRGNVPDYAWTDLTYLLHRQAVSWGYYVFKGTEPDCEDDAAMTCAPVKQGPKTPGIWNPLPYFDTVKADGQLGNVQTIDNFYAAARNGTLPSVSWLDPNGKVSEHPTALVSDGQAYVTSLVNAVMRGPDWKDTAIFVSWDDWGGFYDHVVPPAVDQNGYGLRVPGLVISPYAKAGLVDHQTLSHDAYVKFIEDDFLGGQRIDPATDGRPDPRPDVRENAPQLGDLRADFNFNQAPRPPVLLPTRP